MDAKRGFHYLSSPNVETTKTCLHVYTTPITMVHNNISYVYKPIEVAIGSQIELVFNFDDTNKIRKNPKFYIVINPERR
jgi:hypothetical protein